MAGLTYSTGAPSSANQQPVMESQNQTSNKTGTATTGTNTSQTQNVSSSQRQGVNTSSMTPEALAALNQLIQQLVGGQPLISREQAVAQLAAKGITPPAGGAISGGYQVNADGSIQYGNGRAATAGDPAALAQYEQQVNALMMSGGVAQAGTPEQQRQSQQVQDNISKLTSAREGYSKENAFIDASALQANAMRKMLEAVLPQLNQAIEASGTSGGATSGLLANDAAARAAESAAALGLQAAVDYGNVSNNMSKILSDLVDKSPVVLNSLLQALTVAKGAVQVGSTSTVGDQVTTTKGIQSQDQQSSENAKVGGTKIATPASKVAGQTQVADTPFGSYRF